MWVKWLVHLLIAHVFLTELLSLIRETQRRATKGKKADGDKTAEVVTRSLKADKEQLSKAYDCILSAFFPSIGM